MQSNTDKPHQVTENHLIGNHHHNAGRNFHLNYMLLHYNRIDFDLRDYAGVQLKSIQGTLVLTSLIITRDSTHAPSYSPHSLVLVLKLLACAARQILTIMQLFS